MDARHPGSVNDNYVLRNSSLYTKYNRGEVPFEGAKVLGDMGYESFCPWLLTPFPGKYISTTSYLSIFNSDTLLEKAYLDYHSNKIATNYEGKNICLSCPKNGLVFFIAS